MGFYHTSEKNRLAIVLQSVLKILEIYCHAFPSVEPAVTDQDLRSFPPLLGKAKSAKTFLWRERSASKRHAGWKTASMSEFQSICCRKARIGRLFEQGVEFRADSTERPQVCIGCNW